MKLEILEPSFSVIKLQATKSIPDWAVRGEWFSVTRTEEELSIVCITSSVMQESDSVAEHGWRGIKVMGTLDFSLTGILASLAVPLAEHNISIFAISTFNTDYLLVKEESLLAAKEVLEQAGHSF